MKWSVSRRQKLYSLGLFNCLVHLMRGHEDGYFTRYESTLVRDHRECGSRNIVRNVKNYIKVSIAKREVERLQFAARTLMVLRYRRAAPNWPLGQDP